MSSVNVDLGNVQYVYLRNVECNNGIGGASQSIFTWTMPYMPPREAPYMFIQVAQLYVDHAAAGAGLQEPQHLVFTSINGLNSYSTGSSQLACVMMRDALAQHWTNMPESPMIQVPSNINSLSFSINSNLDGDPYALGAGGCIDILLKIVRPKQDVIMQNTLASYVRTL